MGRITRNITRTITTKLVIGVFMLAAGIAVGVGIAYASISLGPDSAYNYLGVRQGFNVGYSSGDNPSENEQPPSPPAAAYPDSPTNQPIDGVPANGEIRFKSRNYDSGVVSDAYLKLGSGYKRIWAYKVGNDENINVNAATVRIQSVHSGLSSDTSNSNNETRGRVFVTAKDVIVQIGQ